MLCYNKSIAIRTRIQRFYFSPPFCSTGHLAGGFFDALYIMCMIHKNEVQNMCNITYLQNHVHDI